MTAKGGRGSPSIALPAKELAEVAYDAIEWTFDDQRLPRGMWVVEPKSGSAGVEVVRCEADSTDHHHDGCTDAERARLERRVQRVLAVAADGLEVGKRIQFGMSEE